MSFHTQEPLAEHGHTNLTSWGPNKASTDLDFFFVNSETLEMHIWQEKNALIMTNMKSRQTA